MKRNIQGIEVEVIKGDISSQGDIDAVVNAANAELRIGGGVAGAIHKAAGPELEEECRSLAPITPGEAVISGAHKLPNKYVIHCLGPVYGRDKPENELLANCYHNALKIADAKNIKSIAFPSISTGAFGYPLDDAAEVAITAINNQIPHLRKTKHIRFVLFSEKDLQVFEHKLDRLS